MQLTTICKTLRDATYASNTEYLTKLAELVGAGVHISYEVVKSGPPTAKRGFFAKVEGAELGRVLLSSSKGRGDPNVPLHQETAGVVIDYNTWKVLAVPPRLITHRFKKQQVIANIAQYTAYEINDGTTCTLYYYNGAWRMSSQNGYDVSNFKWMGRLTYMEAFVEAAGPAFSFDNLNTKHCYTVGFRHHEMHPLVADPQRAWIIQAVDLAAFNDGATNYAADTACTGLTGQRVVPIPTGAKLSNWLVRHGQGSLGAYLRGRPNPPIYYGAILRGNPGYPDILLESDLMSTIRNLMYNFPKECGANVVPETRASYMVLRALLKGSPHFLSLFPQFRKQYKKYEESLDDLADRVLKVMTTGEVGPNQLDQYANSVAVQLSQVALVNPNNGHAKSIVVDYLTTAGDSDRYFQMFA